MSHYFNYFLIVLGAFVALYSETETKQNQYLLIGGIIIIMVGVYRISKNIPSRHTDENTDFETNKDD